MAVKVTLDPKLLSRVARDQVGPLIDVLTRLTRDEIINVMKESDPSGRIYMVPRRHQASKKGEAPAIVEGEYRDAWATKRAKVEGRRIVGRVYNPITLGAKRTPLWAILNYGYGRTHIEPALTRVAAKARRLLRKR